MFSFPNSSEEVRLLRTIMVERETKPAQKAGQRFKMGSWQFVKIGILLFSLSMAGGCSAGVPASTTTTTLPHPQPTTLVRPFHTSVQTLDGAFTIALDITPNHAGPNHIHMQVMENHTHTVATHVTITLYTTMQDMAMGTDSVVLHAEGGGQFSATSDILSMGGHWALGITIQTSNHVIHKAGVSFVMPL